MVRQRGEGAEPVVNTGISANLARLGGMIAVADTRGASTPEWEIEDSGFKLAVASQPSATAKAVRLNGSKESLGTVGRRDRVAHECMN